MTHKRLLASVALCAAALLSPDLLVPTARAQEPHHPQISIVHSGLSRLKSDLKLMLDLATDDQQWWENWDTVIDLFAFGLDYERPLRVDVMTGFVPAATMVYGPYEDPIDDLLFENLEPAEFYPKKISENFYETLEPGTGWFRVLPNLKYAILTPTNDQNHSLLKQLILKAVDPSPVIDQVLAGGASMGVLLVNEANTEADQEKRRASFQDLRAERMSLLTKRPDETASRYALRRGIVEVYLDELERLLVEASRARSQSFLNTKGPDAKITFEADAIAETSLANSIDQFNKLPDHFASVSKAEGSALSLRINHPIDEMRQASANKIIDLIRADVEANASADDSSLSEEQQEAALQLFDGIMAVVKDGIASGNLNAFVESVPAESGDFSSWGSATAVDPKRLDETLGLIAKTGEGNEVDLNADKVGEVNIHRIKLREGFLRVYDDVFGAGAELHIATSDDKVWFATGPGSLESLKTAIGGLKEPADNDVVLEFEMQLRPWVAKAKALADARPEPEDLDKVQTLRELKLRLTQALDSLNDADDDLTFSMGVKDGTASGSILVNTGLLRFVGTQLETFSRNSLQ